MAQSLLIVCVAEVEPHVARLREQFDPSAKRGLGAHITVLYSSLPPKRIAKTAIQRVAAVASAVAPFSYQVTRVARFPGTLYLTAEPAAPFVSLHEQLVAVLPASAADTDSRQEYLPHISIVRKSAADDRDVEAELTALLEHHGPIACSCTEIVLLANSSGAWLPMRKFALSGGTGSPSQGPS